LRDRQAELGDALHDELGDYGHAHGRQVPVVIDPAFPACVASKLYTYALGRGLVKEDPAHLEPTVLAAIASKFSSTGLEFKDLTDKDAKLGDGTGTLPEV
jgi:hypothetical protein